MNQPDGEPYRDALALRRAVASYVAMTGATVRDVAAILGVDGDHLVDVMAGDAPRVNGDTVRRLRGRDDIWDGDFWERVDHSTEASGFIF